MEKLNENIYNYSNFGIDKLIQQINQISRPIIDMINSNTYQIAMKSTLDICVESNKIMKEYLNNNVVENIIKPMLSTYTNQMNKILDVIPTMMTDNLCNTLASYRSIINEINFDKIEFYNDGTIEYEGKHFTEEDIEITSDEMAEEISINGNFKFGSVLKKIILCVIGTFLIYFLQTDDLKYLLLLMFSGFVSQPGADAYNFLKDKFKRVFKKDLVSNEYFDNYSALIQIDNLKLRKKPTTDAKVIANLKFGSSVEIKNQLESWYEINYCIDEENNTYISGWIYANGIKRINKIKTKLLN